MLLAKYKDIFGKPGEGIHAYRVFNVAIVDLLLTLLAATAVSYYTDVNLLLTVVAFLLIGIVAHWLFGVDTTINKQLKLNIS